MSEKVIIWEKPVNPDDQWIWDCRLRTWVDKDTGDIYSQPRGSIKIGNPNDTGLFIDFNEE